MSEYINLITLLRQQAETTGQHGALMRDAANGLVALEAENGLQTKENDALVEGVAAGKRERSAMRSKATLKEVGHAGEIAKLIERLASAEGERDAAREGLEWCTEPDHNINLDGPFFRKQMRERGLLLDVVGEHLTCIWAWSNPATPTVNEMLHPLGRCTCHGEGTCEWCRNAGMPTHHTGDPTP